MQGTKIVAGAMGATVVLAGAVALAGWGGRGPCVGVGRAHAGPAGGPGAGRFVARILDQVDLTHEQRTKIEALVTQAQPEIDRLRDQLRTMRQSYRASHAPGAFDEATVRAEMAKRAAVHDLAVALGKLRAEVYRVLSPEQQQKLSEWRTNCLGLGSGRHHGRRR